MEWLAFLVVTGVTLLSLVVLLGYATEYRERKRDFDLLSNRSAEHYNAWQRCEERGRDEDGEWVAPEPMTPERWAELARKYPFEAALTDTSTPLVEMIHNRQRETAGEDLRNRQSKKTREYGEIATDDSGLT